MSDTVVAALIGVGGILLGTVIAAGTTALEAHRGVRERARIRREQNLLAAFQYFDGGTQKRSVGLSIIEASWQDMPTLLPMFVPLLTHQAIHLVTQSREKDDAALEYRNLDRIVALLAKPSAAPGALDSNRELCTLFRERAGRTYERGLRLRVDRVNRYLYLLGEAGDLQETSSEHNQGEACERAPADALHEQQRDEQD